MILQKCLSMAAIGLCLQAPFSLRAQDKMPVKFGKVTPADFNVTGANIDTSADAIIVADYGSSVFEGDPKGWFNLEFHRSKRIRILKRTGFEAATVEIPLYTQNLSTQERVIGLKASTYTLEGGTVVETKLDSKSIFTDKIDKNWTEQKFTFPALKEGAILEYSYTLQSPFISNLQSWDFQGQYPCLWSEYEVDIPNFFKYATLAQGFLPFKVNATDSRMASFHVSQPGEGVRTDRFDITDNVVSHRWVMANIPAMRPEPFTTTIHNYVSRIEFQLAGVQFEGNPYEDRLGSWPKISERLMNGDFFGADLARNNGWMDEDMAAVVKGAAGNLEKAEKIFAFVRDNFTCTSHAGLDLSNSLKTIYKNRSGNEADLNLLLTAMLLHEHLQADPVILSTRAHGFTHPVYPLLPRYNYVICALTIDSSRYFLDASEPWGSFGRLPGRCYNGLAELISTTAPSPVELSADAVTEGKTTMVIIRKDEKGGLDAQFHIRPGFEEASTVREEIKEHGEKDYLKKLQALYTGDATVADLELDSLRLPDQPLEIGYSLHLTPDAATDVYYFSPMLGEGYRANPFKSEVRSYPVEMQHAMDETYTLTMEIPSGFVVDEIPKSTKVSFNTDEGFFEYIVVKDDNQVQMRSRIKLRKANYTPEDYSTLRDFFAFIVKKQGEQIVFKKKK